MGGSKNFYLIAYQSLLLLEEVFSPCFMVTFDIKLPQTAQFESSSIRLRSSLVWNVTLR